MVFIFNKIWETVEKISHLFNDVGKNVHNYIYVTKKGQLGKLSKYLCVERTRRMAQKLLF